LCFLLFMMAVYLIVIPLLGALAAFLVPADRVRPWIVAAAAAMHTALTLVIVRMRGKDVYDSSWLRLDSLGRLVLLVISILFLICAAYCVGYLHVRANRPNRIFCTALLGFLGMTTLVTLAQHLTILWVAMEATTLATAVLLYFNQNRRSLEATWKYLMIGSVGIALALLGTLFLAYGALLGLGEPTLLFPDLVRRATRLPVPWVRTAFVFLLVGYGTKMGLAPMHTWKPDAYGEAPGIIGAILAGAVTTVAFTAILRVRAVVAASGAAAITDRTLLVIGLFSMLVAAIFLLGTRDFKRMLAYSSVEHMGILCIGAGLGTAGMFAALFHVWNNSLTKAALFMSAGNLHRAAGARTIDQVSGMARVTPRSAWIFIAGLFA